MRRFPLLGVLIAAIGIAAVVLVLERMPLPDGIPPQEPSVPAKLSRERARKPAGPGMPAPAGKIVVIIDDIGYDQRMLEELIAIPAPIAFAVLPHTPYAEEAAKRLHAAGKEILVHLPMEPHSYPEDNPGEGALFANMSDEAIRRHLAAALKQVPQAVGLNNHMGSRFMEDESRMAIVMGELAKRGLFFVDSLTTAASRGRDTAFKAGVPFAARSAFIDHPPNDGEVFERLRHLPRRQARAGTPLVLIGHPRLETLRALRKILPLWKDQGQEVISLAAFFAERAGAAGKDTLR